MDEIQSREKETNLNIKKTTYSKPLLLSERLITENALSGTCTKDTIKLSCRSNPST